MIWNSQVFLRFNAVRFPFLPDHFNDDGRKFVTHPGYMTQMILDSAPGIRKAYNPDIIGDTDPVIFYLVIGNKYGDGMSFLRQHFSGMITIGADASSI